MLQYVLTSIVQMLAAKWCHAYINVPMLIYTELSLHSDSIQVRFAKHAKLWYFSQYSRLLNCEFLCCKSCLKKVFNLDKNISVAHRSKKSTIMVDVSANRERQGKKLPQQNGYIFVSNAYKCYRCLDNFMMILQEMSYDNLVLICIFCKHLMKI